MTANAISFQDLRIEAATGGQVSIKDFAEQVAS